MSSQGLSKEVIQRHVRNLVDCLVNIKDETGEFLLRLDDGRVIDTKGWNDWEWTHGIGLYGLFKLYEINQDEEVLKIAVAWYDARLPVGTTKNINTMSPFLTLAHLQSTGLTSRSSLGAEVCSEYLLEWVEYIMREAPRTLEGGLQHATYTHVHEGQLWDDTLMMSVLPLAKIGMILGNTEYVEEAKRQFLVHIKYLADRKTGLWFHGWTFEGRHNFANALWARGNCWVTIAIPDFLEILAADGTSSLSSGAETNVSGVTSFLHTTLLAQIDALLPLQDHQTGLWHTLLDDPSSYLEASASAGFAYGILKALRLCLIPSDKKNVFRSCAEKAIAGVASCIDSKGEVHQVSFGTPVFDTKEDYKQIRCTSMPYGQSLTLLALGEWLRQDLSR